ncbi:LuxR family two component transcriptional regulator [Nocardia pseudobrasiliensis]|uniref:LuxR family two component transcriptional regulator n=1 Tax=Nocardia pseudobrasiliensis TaxID=45979 RepID=A0A370I2K9_9NOCA|nr:LuxR family two component transcriptional regulator [Nocardia pseudobrasiliensis]
MTIRVFLVDDHAVFRSGVRAELGRESDIEVVGEAGGVSEAIAGIKSARPDVVLLDVHMPDGGGVAVLQGIEDHLDGQVPEEAVGVTTQGPRSGGSRQSPVCLALSVSDAAEDVIAVIRAGARGYVTKTISGPELADGIRRVSGGDAVFSPRLAGFVLDSFTGRSPAPEPPLDPELDSLTPRELEVLRLLARGYTYREIAESLFISVKTVETHASNVLRKTQQSNRNALTRWAHRRRID